MSVMTVVKIANKDNKKKKRFFKLFSETTILKLYQF